MRGGLTGLQRLCEEVITEEQTGGRTARGPPGPTTQFHYEYDWYSREGSPPSGLGSV